LIKGTSSCVIKASQSQAEKKLEANPWEEEKHATTNGPPAHVPTASSTPSTFYHSISQPLQLFLYHSSFIFDLDPDPAHCQFVSRARVKGVQRLPYLHSPIITEGVSGFWTLEPFLSPENNRLINLRVAFHRESPQSWCTYGRISSRS
jgi:hypothetical protein